MLSELLIVRKNKSKNLSSSSLNPAAALASLQAASNLQQAHSLHQVPGLHPASLKIKKKRSAGGRAARANHQVDR